MDRVDWSVNWSVDWSVDWIVDWSVDWSNDWSFDWNKISFDCNILCSSGQKMNMPNLKYYFIFYGKFFCSSELKLKFGW